MSLRQALHRATSIMPSPVVATRGAGIGGTLVGNSQNTALTVRFPYDTTAVQVVYANLTGADTVGSDQLTIKAGLTYGGTTYPLFAYGKRSMVVDAGAIIVTQPVHIEASAGSTASIRTNIVSAGANTPWSNYLSGNQSDGYELGTDLTDKSLTGTIAAAGSGASMNRGYHPYAVLGVTTPYSRPAVAIVGDSIAIGDGDYTTNSDYYQGYIARGLANGFPYCNPSVGGSTLSAFNTNHTHRAAAFTGCTHAILEYGTNDIQGNTISLLSAMQTRYTTAWATLKRYGLKVWQCTLLPRYNGGSGGTPDTSEALRTGLNDWFRSSATTYIDGIFEAADLAETSRNSGVWRANYTSDGVHPNSAGHAAISACITTAVLV